MTEIVSEDVVRCSLSVVRLLKLLSLMRFSGGAGWNGQPTTANGQRLPSRAGRRLALRALQNQQLRILEAHVVRGEVREQQAAPAVEEAGFEDVELGEARPRMQH